METGKLRVAFCGTRGVPANYGGFETAVDEISNRMTAQGVECSVFCRHHEKTEKIEYLNGRKLIYIKGNANRKVDTFESSIRTGIYLLKNRKNFDFVYWFNNANVLGILLTVLTRIPMAVNTDGLEWRRAKWSWPFKLFYFFSSLIISLFCKQLISDSISIQQYYKKTFYKNTCFIPYGAPVAQDIEIETKQAILKKYNLEENKYFLQITRLEPDNLPLDIIKGFINSNLHESGYKFVLIGYKDDTTYSIQIKALNQISSVNVLPANYNPVELAVLRTAAHCYVHGNSVGGTNPALLEAMSCCQRIMAIDGPFSKEVLGDYGILFQVDQLALSFKQSLSMVAQSREMKLRLKNSYQWDAVAESYKELATTRSADYVQQIKKRMEVDLTTY